MQRRNRYSVYEMMPGNEIKTERVKEEVIFNSHTHTYTHTQCLQMFKDCGPHTKTYTLTHIILPFMEIAS